MRRWLHQVRVVRGPQSCDVTRSYWRVRVQLRCGLIAGIRPCREVSAGSARILRQMSHGRAPDSIAYSAVARSTSASWEARFVLPVNCRWRRRFIATRRLKVAALTSMHAEALSDNQLAQSITQLPSWGQDEITSYFCLSFVPLPWDKF